MNELGHHYYKMDKIEQAAKERKSQWQTASSASQFHLSSSVSIQARSSSFIFQVLIGFF